MLGEARHVGPGELGREAAQLEQAQQVARPELAQRVHELLEFASTVDFESVGVDRVLTMLAAAGVTLAIVRKARDVFWAGIGMILLLQRGLSLRAIARDAEQALAREAKLAVSANPASQSS